jgi:hypothetical protein
MNETKLSRGMKRARPDAKALNLTARKLLAEQGSPEREYLQRLLRPVRRSARIRRPLRRS